MQTILFLGDVNEHNVLSMRRILKVFELLSGLRVNFHKCSLMGLNLERGEINGLARKLNCRVGALPFSFLGVTVGLDGRNIEARGNLVQKIKKKLKKWEHKNISFGGRVVLLKAVLSSIPTYTLSFYKLPKKVIKSLTSLQRNFLWGGNENK